jgi:very-short-patch-repair endonuclease
MFLAALCARWEGSVSCGDDRAYAHLAAHPEWAGLFRVVVEPQKLIRTEGGTYRADVFLYVTRVRVEPEGDQWGPIVVEIDGYEFHERTKEQAARDRKRDRDLVREGIRVVRFTGAEVFHRPFECAREVDELLCQTARETLEGFRSAGRLDELVVGGSA